MRRVLSCVALLLAAGPAACGDDLPDPNTMPDDGTSTGATSTGATGFASTTTGAETSASSSSTSSAGGTFGDVDDCAVTADCAPGTFCVAPFDESLGPEGKGLNECVRECVGIMDETLWCADASACCDPAAECTDRGYCVLPGESTGGDGSGTGDESSTGGTSTGG